MSVILSELQYNLKLSNEEVSFIMGIDRSNLIHAYKGRRPLPSMSLDLQAELIRIAKKTDLVSEAVMESVDHYIAERSDEDARQQLVGLEPLLKKVVKSFEEQNRNHEQMRIRLGGVEAWLNEFNSSIDPNMHHRMQSLRETLRYKISRRSKRKLEKTRRRIASLEAEILICKKQLSP